MKNYATIAFIVLGLFFASAANAEAQCPPQLRAHIPFDFSAGKRDHKAGDYIIEKINCAAAVRKVILRDARGKALGIITPLPAIDFDRSLSSGVSKLLFINRAGSWLLAEIVQGNSRYSLLSRRDRPERLTSLKSRPDAERQVTVMPMKKGN